MMKRRSIHLLFFASLLLSVQLVSAQLANLAPVKEKILGEEFEEAGKELQSLLTTNPKNADEVYFWLGQVEFLKENYPKAADFFKKGLDVRSKSPLNIAGSGLVKVKMGSVEEALPMFDEAFTLSKGKDPDVLLTISDAYLIAGGSNIAKAKTYLYQLRDNYPNDPRAFLALGDYYKSQGVPELAAEEYQRALKLVPDYVPALVAMAELKYNAGREAQKKGESASAFYQEGYGFANKAVTLKPGFAPAYKIRGELYLLAKEYQRARDDYKKYVELTQNDLKARIRYASFLFLCEDYDATLAELATIKKDTVTNVMLRIEGLALLKKGRTAEAKASLDEYFKRVKPEFHINEDYEAYGDILRAMGNIEQADVNYEQAIKLNPYRNEKYLEVSDEYGATAVALVKAIRAKEVTVGSDSVEKLYGLQAHYMDRYIKSKEGQVLKDYYTLGQAYYFSKQFEKSLEAYNTVVELKDDYIGGHAGRLRAANKIEEADTTQKFVLTVPISQKLVELCEAQGTAANKSIYVSSLVVLAFHSYLSNQADAAGGCAKAQVFIDKVLAIDPANKDVASLIEFCATVKSNK